MHHLASSLSWIIKPQSDPGLHTMVENDHCSENTEIVCTARDTVLLVLCNFLIMVYKEEHNVLQCD